MRRASWPERDKLNELLRTSNELINTDVKLFLRDAYDHCVQTIDMVESLKEISASNIDMYLSIISNRMNEIMKVLTVTSAIFIPLTFIVGVYGMNFENMPELQSEHGYFFVWGFMILMTAILVFIFWKRGWLKRND